MKKYFDSIREHLQTELARSARDYLKNGLELFHKERCSSLPSIQPPIGNLIISVELMLKTFIVKNNPLLLFSGLPIELQILFTCPDAIPKGFNWRKYDIDIRSFNFKTIKLDECISIFYILEPKYKQALKPYFRLLSRCRNASVHASLPSFQKYDLERSAYVALRVFEILNGSNTFRYQKYLLTDNDKEFLSAFEEERAENVRKKIEKAKEKSKELIHKEVRLDLDDLGNYWDQYIADCPICGSEGVLTGYTDISEVANEDGYPYPCLDFFADSFECKECGLILEDIEELRLSGIDLHYDRSDALDRWVEEG